MNRILLLLALAACSLSAPAQETLYITDILQLDLYRSSDGSGDPIRNLVSGTELTVLERVPNFVRVRTATGEEGWVKSAFLVSEKPAQARIAEVEADRQRLQAELDAAQAAGSTAAVEAQARLAEASVVLASADAERERVAQLQRTNEALLDQVNRYRGAIPWQWAAVALAVAVGGGFLLGYWWLDASIRRRHGGFRVH